MSFEDKFLGGLDWKKESRQELAPFMERAHRKAVGVLRDPEHTIQESEFVSVYGKEQVEADRALTTRLRSKFDMNQTNVERQSKRIADTLEAIIIEEAELSEWFGTAMTYKTADYDDFKNKVDMIAEWQTPNEGSRTLALAVDVTFGRDSISKKIAEIRQEIDSGQLGSIKYFKDANGDFMGTRNNVPRTVIGVSQPAVEQLASLWVNGEKKRLGEHPMQCILATQMWLQLDLMEKYATSIGKEGVAQSIRRTLIAVEELRNTKKDMRVGDLADDPVVTEIISQARQQFRV